MSIMLNVFCIQHSHFTVFGLLYCHPYYMAINYTSVQISIINHTLPSTIRAVIGTLACTSMASNSTSDSEC